MSTLCRSVDISSVEIWRHKSAASGTGETAADPARLRHWLGLREAQSSMA